MLARILGPTQLGLAAAIAVTVSFFDSISDTGSDRFLIQDHDGDTLSIQGLVQLVYSIRGIVIAASLVIVAIPISYLYGMPTISRGLAAYAVVPLLGGFVNLNYRRLQRQHDFAPEAVMIITSEIISIIITITSALILRSYFAVIIGQCARAITNLLLSHILSDRKYGWAFGHFESRRLAKFAAPLMLNGVFLFFGMQGDRVIVANRLGVSTLGVYSAIILLVYYPSGVLSKFLHAIYLPVIAGARGDKDALIVESKRLAGTTFFLSTAMAVGFSIVGPLAVSILYGRRFRETVVVVALIGILQSSRFLISWPTTIALGLGRSDGVFLTNLARVVAFPAAIAGVQIIGGIPGFLLGFMLGEAASLLVSILLVNRLQKVPAFADLDRLVTWILTALSIVYWVSVSENHPPLMLSVFMAISDIALAIFVVRKDRIVVKDVARAIQVSRAYRRHR